MLKRLLQEDPLQGETPPGTRFGDVPIYEGLLAEWGGSPYETPSWQQTDLAEAEAAPKKTRPKASKKNAPRKARKAEGDATGT